MQQDIIWHIECMMLDSVFVNFSTPYTQLNKTIKLIQLDFQGMFHNDSLGKASSSITIRRISMTLPK
jgi:hypothetical protein